MAHTGSCFFGNPLQKPDLSFALLGAHSEQSGELSLLAVADDLLQERSCFAGFHASPGSYPSVVAKVHDQRPSPETERGCGQAFGTELV